MPAGRQSKKWNTFLFVGFAIFISETLVMIVLSIGGLGERLTIFYEAVLDSSLLLLLVFPILHYSLFRPMRLQIANLRKAKAQIRRKNRELNAMAGKNEMILSVAEEGILGLDKKGKTIFTNPAAEKILGWSTEELIDRSHHGMIHSFCEGDAQGGMCPARQCLSTGRVARQLEGRFRKKDGSIFPAEISCAPMKDGAEIIGAVLTFRDITERKEAEIKLKNMAYFDPLTGSANRSLLQDRFSRIVAHARRARKIPAIIFLDLDDFKEINDLHGHAAGDSFLREIADRIRGAVRDTDTVARVGGDEFVWAGLVCGKQDAEMVAKKILRALSAPVFIGERSVQVSASIGIAIHGRHGTTLDELLKSADCAMYEAKEKGKDRYFFSGKTHEVQASTG